jgi:hypothetical protein
VVRGGGGRVFGLQMGQMALAVVVARVMAGWDSTATRAFHPERTSTGIGYRNIGTRGGLGGGVIAAGGGGGTGRARVPNTPW